MGNVLARFLDSLEGRTWPSVSIIYEVGGRCHCLAEIGLLQSQRESFCAVWKSSLMREVGLLGKAPALAAPLAREKRVRALAPEGICFQWSAFLRRLKPQFRW